MIPRTCNFRGCRAFTLVELLVVIGIIAVLIALLLSVLTGARKQAYRVACMSNLRQVGHAMLAYAQAHKGAFPAPAYAGWPHSEDWVHWQPDDPIRPGGRDLLGAGIMPYLDKSVDVLKCPMGVPERGLTLESGVGPRTFPPYPFSYSVNVRFTGQAGGSTFDPRINGGGFAVLGRIINPSEKAMMIEEDVTGINDGDWNPGSGDHASFRESSVSFRHDKNGNYEGDPRGNYYRPLGNPNGQGLVFFADGHCEMYPRWNLGRAKYYHPNYREP